MRVVLMYLVAILSSSCGLAVAAARSLPPENRTRPITSVDGAPPDPAPSATSVDRYPPLPSYLPYPFAVWAGPSKTNITLVVWQMIVYPISYQDVLVNIINAQNAVFRGAVAHGFNSSLPAEGLEWPYGGCWLQLSNASPQHMTWMIAADVLLGVKDLMRQFGVWMLSFDVKVDGKGVVGWGYHGP